MPVRPLAQEGSPAVRRMARDIRAVLEALDVEHALVVGHSMGGMVALQLAHDTPADELHRRVAGLALVVDHGGPFTKVPGFGGMARLAGPASARALSLADRWGVRTVASQDLRWWLTRRRVRGRGPAGPGPIRRGSPPGDGARPPWPSSSRRSRSSTCRNGSGSIDLPVLVVVGSNDRLTPPRHALRTAAALPHSELVELPRCGHMPMIERRHEFARLVEEFAAKIG